VADRIGTKKGRFREGKNERGESLRSDMKARTITRIRKKGIRQKR